jgi:hypothetical protein
MYNKFILVETKSICLSVVVRLKYDVETVHNEDLIIGTPFCINIIQVAVVVKWNRKSMEVKWNCMQVVEKRTGYVCSKLLFVVYIISRSVLFEFV